MPRTWDGSRLPVRAALALPGAFVATVAAAVVLGVGAQALGLSPLADPLQSRLAVAVLLVVAVGAGLVLTRRAGDPGRWGWLAVVPAGLLVAYAAVARVVLTPGERMEWFLGGDHVRHLLMVAEVRTAGSLDYGVQPYPRAWHTLLAAAWSSTGAQTDAAGLSTLVELTSTATWLLPGLVSLAVGCLALAVARGAGLGERGAGVAGAVAAGAILLPPFTAVYQALGFETSLVGAVAVVVSARLVLAPASMTSVVLASASLLVVAHTWQLLLPAVGVSLLAVVVRLARRRRALVPTALVLAGTAVAAYPGVFSVATGVGVGHASAADVEAPHPIALVAAGLASAVWLAARQWPSWRGPALVAVVVMPALTALGIAVQQGIGLGSYYPSKLLWQTAVLGLASTASVAALGVRHLRRHGALARPTRLVIGAASTVAVLYAALSPLGAFVGAWSTVDGARVLAAVTSPHAAQAQVLWTRGTAGPSRQPDMTDTVGRILLDFYAGGRARTPQGPQSVAEECALLQAAAEPAVLTDRDAAQVRRRYACAPGLEVVPAVDRLGSRVTR